MTARPSVKKPLVGIIMGSASDLPVMREAGFALESLKVPFETTVLSAHRTPLETAAYAESAEKRGLRVIIAGAGGAAHLAGVVASHTTLPVIGVPVGSGPLQGIDALLSTVQMPGGVPVATVAIGRGGAKNAGILAAQILGAGDRALRTRLKRQRAAMGKAVLESARELEGD